MEPSHLPVGLGANLILGAQSSILFPAWGKAITSLEVVAASVAVSSTAENINVSSLHLPCFCSSFTLARSVSELFGTRRRRPMLDDADDPSVDRVEKAAREAVEKAATNTPLFARYRTPRAATASSAIATGGTRIVITSNDRLPLLGYRSARWLVL